MGTTFRDRLKAWIPVKAPRETEISLVLLPPGPFAHDQFLGLPLLLPEQASTSHNWVALDATYHPHDLALTNSVYEEALESRHYLRELEIAPVDLAAQSRLESAVIFESPVGEFPPPVCTGKTYITYISDDGEDSEEAAGLTRLTRSAASDRESPRPRKRGERRSPRGRIPRLDSFDLLLPYLQPSPETLLLNPEFYPRDLRPYAFQAEGVRFLVSRKAALLGDEMGLGKTVQAIIAMQVLYRRREARQTLILCRRSVLSVWEIELKKWAPEFYVIPVRGTPELRYRLWNLPAPVFLTTYETLRQDIQWVERLKRPFDIVILDEIQEIRNPNTSKSQAVRSIQARYRWGLSGTPLENRIEDVVAIFDYLEPSLFRRNKAAALEPSNVKKRIKPYILRRRVADVMKELPKKRVHEVWLRLTPQQRRSYDRLYRAAREELGRARRSRMHVFDWINKLKQICNLDPDTGASCKLDYLIDELEDIVESGQKALVFSQYPNVTLRRIQEQLRAFDPAIFDGTLSDRDRSALIRAFQEESTPRVLLMSVRSGSLGITLTRATHVFHFDHWWNPATAQQAEARAHRIGQKHTVFVHDLYTRHTIEERIYKLLKRKEALFRTVIDDLSQAGVRRFITDEELYALFDLRPPKR